MEGFRRREGGGAAEVLEGLQAAAQQGTLRRTRPEPGPAGGWPVAPRAREVFPRHPVQPLVGPRGGRLDRPGRGGPHQHPAQAAHSVVGRGRESGQFVHDRGTVERDHARHGPDGQVQHRDVRIADEHLRAAGDARPVEVGHQVAGVVAADRHPDRVHLVVGEEGHEVVRALLRGPGRPAMPLEEVGREPDAEPQRLQEGRAPRDTVRCLRGTAPRRRHGADRRSGPQGLRPHHAWAPPTTGLAPRRALGATVPARSPSVRTRAQGRVPGLHPPAAGLDCH